MLKTKVTQISKDIWAIRGEHRSSWPWLYNSSESQALKKPSGLSQWLLSCLVLLIEREHLHSFSQKHSPVTSAMHVAKHNNFALQWCATKWKTKPYGATSWLPIIPVASADPVKPLETQFTVAVVGIHKWRPQKQLLPSLEFPILFTEEPHVLLLLSIIPGKEAEFSVQLVLQSIPICFLYGLSHFNEHSH